MSDARLVSIVVGGSVEPWTALGFTARGITIPFSNGAVECAGLGEGSGVLALRVAGVDQEVSLDGVQVLHGHAPLPAVEHVNGGHELDHVVIMTPSLEATSAAVEELLGLPLRRVRETESVRQAFHRFPDRGCIIEIVESDRVERAALWGVVVTADDLDAFVARAGPERVGDARPAVQPGRRIATVRTAAGLPCPVAVMSR